MRILILSASTGGGHMRASVALKSHILNQDETAVVKIVDTLKYVSPLLNKTVTEGYEYLAKNSPKMYGMMYRSSNKENRFNTFVVTFNHLFSKKLLPLLEEFQPDAIISTHPFATEMASNLKGIENLRTPLVCLMTDYAPHRTWINENVDAYVVSNDSMIDMMEKMGVSRKLIHPFGIPIDDMFHQKKDKNIVLQEMGLKPSIPTILIMAGSFGVTNILKIYNTIIEIDVDFQIIVITGRNQKLYDAFQKLIAKKEKTTQEKHLPFFTPKKQSSSGQPTYDQKEKHAIKDTKLLFFTDEVYKYMQVADLIITKPGGLTVSEALACNLPMAIFNAIPGQEEENAEFLIDNNMAVRLEKNATCSQTIKKLLLNQSELEAMKTSCQNFDKSKSGDNILRLIKELTTKNWEQVAL